jgi:hypothetical protein
LIKIPLFSFDVSAVFDCGGSWPIELFRALSNSEQSVRPARPDRPAHHGDVIPQDAAFDPSKNV